MGSGASFRVAAAFQELKKNMVWILDNAEQATYFFNDLEHLLSPSDALFFPASYRKPYALEETENANVLLRSEVLRKVSRGNKPRLVVTYPQAAFEKLISQHTLKKNTLHINKGDVLSLNFVNETLFEYGFERVDFVTMPGEFAVRGGIIDVFSFAYQHPYRIEFFDETVERLRSFDVTTQLSVTAFDHIELLPNTSSVTFAKKRSILSEFFPADTSFVIDDADRMLDVIGKLFEEANTVYSQNEDFTQYPPEKLFTSEEEWKSGLQKQSVVLLNRSEQFLAKQTLTIKQEPQPAFNKQFNLLTDYLNQNYEEGYRNLIFCASTQQSQRLEGIFQEMEKEVHYDTRNYPIYQGFEDLEVRWACLSDHQIFERYYKYRLKSETIQKNALSLRELTAMEVGDYVTHIDHGIGKFGGLQRINVEGSLQEAIKLIYGDRDILYLSIHSLHKISKYNGKEGAVPKMYKLGSKAWKNLKQKTKTRVKEIAFNLIQLYAKRRQKIGFAYPADSYLQWELEASFLYEDTPDQSKATQDVKADMESEHPMDRLICGDVGFGKTEIAIRAAFKAVDSSKQVAVLVPTTILAYQHFKTFSARLKDLPVNVAYLNRFRSASQRKTILEGVTSGKVDILIGTHQIVNSRTVFKDLGLLIVDEEQKFGVAVKEKLRDLKANVDVLTLTATPIPRTLQFSLMAARDLSVINTPPPNRFPIESEVVRFEETLIRDAVMYEMQRGGQVFFVHNRVENIREVAGLLQRLIPDARIAIGHGQMEGAKLERNLLAFMEGQQDILVATTIIENGLDVPNANTIFINNAQHFGLSDLHQMRGRVGRSNRKAFCYFITPPYTAMSGVAQKRIKAIEQFSALGAGIKIAMKDLEIRGAGDLLGGEQSGFINDMGFETYQKILQEAIDELKEEEFKELYNETADATPKTHTGKEVQIDTDLEAYLPDDYVNSVTERLKMYQSLSAIKDKNALDTFVVEIKDRFGPLPAQAEELMWSVQLKWVAGQLGLERLVIKKGTCLGYFMSDPEHPFFKGTAFSTIIEKVQASGGKAVLKEKETQQGLRLLLRIEDVNSIHNALIFLDGLSGSLE